MLHTAFLSLILFVALSSTSLLSKTISRRQTDPEYCRVIDGFDCKCSYYRVTCTSDRDLPSSINVLQNEKQKYQSVELVINGERDQTVREQTFEPVKELYKPDADNFEFRIKFEKFTALHLSSPSIFNRIFPDNIPSNARKVMAVEIYNPHVQPDNNVNLFANLHVDSLELYSLYPFHGTFQQLFHGANIKYLRLSGGDIRSDLSQPFTGNVGRLELAKQASQLSMQNFPLYPVHEYIINAFYVTDFKSDHPPNYSNVGELRVYSQERIPANAFRQYPNLHTLSIGTERDIDPHALDGLYNLEKLIIKDTKPSLELLNTVPNVKELEAGIERLNEREQCQLIEKLANGQIAVQATLNGHECTCVSAYLNTAAGRYPCDAQNCEQSSCSVIRDNYDASTRSFKTPPSIKRADGTDALRPREPKVYTGPYQIPHQDQEKYKQATPQRAEQPYEPETYEEQQPDVRPYDQEDTRPDMHTTTPGVDQQPAGQQDYWPTEHEYDPSYPYSPEQTHQQQPYVPSQHYPHEPYAPQDEGHQEEDSESELPVNEDYENQQGLDDNEIGPDGHDVENQQEGKVDDESHVSHDPNQSTESTFVDATEIMDKPQSAKKRFSWLPIIIIVAVIAAILLIGLLILIIRKRRDARGYNPTATTEHTAGSA